MLIDMEDLFPNELFESAYKNPVEYVNDQIKCVRVIADHYMDCLEEAQEEEKNIPFNVMRDTAIGDLAVAYFLSGSRIEATKRDNIFIAGEHIRDIYDMENIEWLCLIISIMIEIDEEYRELFSKISGTPPESAFTYTLVLKLYYFVDSISRIDDFCGIISKLQYKMESLCFFKDSMKIDKRLLHFIMGNSSGDILPLGVTVSKYTNEVNTPLPIREKTAQKIYTLSQKKLPDKQIFFYLHGKDGTGKYTLAKRAAQLIGKGIVTADIKELLFLESDTVYNSLLTAFRESLISNSVICIYNMQELFIEGNLKSQYVKFIISKSKQFSRQVFLISLSTNNISQYIPQDIPLIDISVEEPDKSESVILWDKHLKEIKDLTDVKASDMANKFSFTPKQIKGTIEASKKSSLWNNKKKISQKDLCNCAYDQINHKISSNATLIKAKHTWNELVLNPNEKEILRDACDQIRYKHIVYEKWGMNKRLLYGRGLSMLFSGPPGTGKTMAAQVVANELGLELYKVDLSQVISKYIGETEKKLNQLFNEAKESNVILFFDETDAIFGKRTEVKDSHDKNANVETSYLLQKMEEYDGITIMTTNYIENIDKAFFRRISYVIHFAFPDSDARKKIWMKMYPEEMPLSKDIDFDYLSTQFEISGGNIKNVVVASAFMAARDSKNVEMKHIIKALKYELTKQGKILLKEDFGPYGYLIK